MKLKRKKIGLALGSGGARGFCHLGVLKVLLENNIPIDYVSGCSMGALIGGCFCAGVSIDTMIAAAPKISQHSIVDLNISAKKHGLLKGEKAIKIVKDLIGDTQFKECEIPFRATATEVCSGTLVTMTEGKLIDAIRASISIPIAFHAVEKDENVLIDGGILERIPIPAVKDMGADLVIAVDALGKPGIDFDPSEGNGFLSIVERSYLLMDWEGSKDKLKEADVLITPEQGFRSPFIFKDNNYSIEQGVIAAEQMMPQIMELIG